MSPTLNRMSPLDSEFFYAEHRKVPMHIGSVAVFDGLEDGRWAIPGGGLVGRRRDVE